MSFWTRIFRVFRTERLIREIDEEQQSHLDEAIEHGRDPDEIRKAFGSSLRHREESRDVQVFAWLDSMRADAVFGWRRIMKTKATSAAAILSLALAIGACTSAFRLIDALLLRPLPVVHPEQLYGLSRDGFSFDGKPNNYDTWAYPAFRLMRAAVKDQAELIAISLSAQTDLTYRSDQEMEKAEVQYVSGWMFQSLGLQPALGRLLTESDDLKPGAHPVAVISQDYWTRRFNRDPQAVGRTFRIANDIYQILGVVEERFTGTQPGTMIDVYLPTMMRMPAVTRADSTWFRTIANLKPRVNLEVVRAKLDAATRAFETERAKGFIGWSKERIDRALNQRLSMDPAGSGVSTLQKNYRKSLIAIGILVALVLLIACANVANLMTAQAAARSREMALRLSIGAGRWRLIQLVLVESAWISSLAAALGALFAWWSAPFVVRMINPPSNPARLVLPADWRVFGFAVLLTLGVTLLFGLAPALRASSIRPASALKGGEDPHSRRRMMHALIAMQVAFCFLVLFVAGLFVATFDRLTHLPTGFSDERMLTLDTVAANGQLPPAWDEVASHLRATPGVEAVSLAAWPLLSGTQTNNFISINGAPSNNVIAWFLSVSPGWLDTMKIPLIDGRDFNPADANPGAAIVNEAFVRQFFNGTNPVGKSFQKTAGAVHVPFQIVGVVRDAVYQDLREKSRPVAYVPFLALGTDGAQQKIGEAIFLVRTSSANPLAMASTLRQEVPRARSEFRVSNIRTQKEIDDSQTIRERLLAMLAFFFASVALLLGGVGLYGVLNYSVVQRRREIGIRMAIGAQASGIARLVTADVFAMVLTGAVAGVALGLSSVRYLEALFYQVKATDIRMLVLPAGMLFAAALLASLPAVAHAVRIDPVKALREE